MPSATDYSLNVHLPDGTSAYTFCMCPGGEVIAAASEPGGVDLDAAAALGHDAVRAFSLPGRVAPLSAGRLLRDAILVYLDLR